MTDIPILYSFRRCPYAMRARLALYISGVMVELREVVLRDKPGAMLDVSSKGTVPVLLLQDGRVIDESLDVMLWALEQSDPQGWLEGDVPAMKALIQENDTGFKKTLDRYKYASRYQGVDPMDERKKAESFLQDLEGRLQQHVFLFGNNPTLADYAIFPFIRQFAFTDKNWFDSAPYPKLQSWLLYHFKSEIFENVMGKYPQWLEGEPGVSFGQK